MAILAGCTSTPSPESPNRTTSAPSERGAPKASVQLPQAKAGPREDTPSALEDMDNGQFPKPLLDTEQIMSGGPPPDGIPAIDQPRFLRAKDIDWLAANEPVLSLTVGDETRGYPIQIMTWHEIVNDTVDGVPVAVTYCPLCNSGVAFRRRAAGRVLSFGTSGKLYANNLVMYDRQTYSLWPQLTGQAAVGVLTGTKLKAIPMGAVAWRDFRTEHPDAWVLSRNTGHDRNYGINPYDGYDDPDGGLLFDLPREDGRLPVKERVVGVQHNGQAVAVVRTSLADKGVLALEVGGRELVAWHRPGQVSALDTLELAQGRDIGSIAVFDPYIDRDGDRQKLHFRPADDGFTDAETGSRWNIQGRATSGPLSGKHLAAYQHLDTFWFAWVAFQPGTRIVR